METSIEELPDIQKEQLILASYYPVLIKNFYINYLSNKSTNINDLIKGGVILGLTETATKEIIQNFQDEDGNTFSHFLVTQQANKNLKKCAEKGLISFKKNKQDLSAYDIAFTNFSNAIKQEIDNQNNDIDDQNDDVGSCLDKSRCTYLILANYIKIKQGKQDDCVICCSSHKFFDKGFTKI